MVHRRLTVVLKAEDHGALLALAARERRPIRDEAAYLILSGLRAAGLDPDSAAERIAARLAGKS